MYSFAQLQREIGAKIQWLRDNNGTTLHPDWVTQSVMNDHPDIVGTDAEFHLCSSRAAIRNEVRQQINKLDAPRSENSQQLILEGFEYLQQYYVVNRDDEQVAVRIDHLTDEEIDVKAAEHSARGRSELAHSDELIRYKELRRQQKLEFQFPRAAGTAAHPPT